MPLSIAAKPVWETAPGDAAAQRLYARIAGGTATRPACRLAAA